MRRRLIAIGCVLVAATMASAQGDDAPTVATAEALVAAVAAGGVVWVASGDYVIAEPLVVGHDLELRGVEPLMATLYLQGSPEGLRVEGGADVRIAGIRLAYDAEAPGDAVRVHDAQLTLDEVAVGFAVGVPDAADDDPLAYGRGLHLTGDAQVDVLGGGIGRNERMAALVRDSARLHLVDALLTGDGAGVVAQDDAVVTLRGVELFGHLDYALALRGRAQATGGGNLFVENGIASEEQLISAVYVGDQATLHLEGGDTFRDHPGGVFEIFGAANVTLIDATVELTGTWAHTYVVGNATLSVEGGRFADNEGAFYAGEGGRVVLVDVVMTGGAGDGVIVDESGFVDVRGGRIDDHANFGVALYGFGRVHVEGTTVARNRSGLVAMGASTLIVRDTDVVDHERTGIGFLDASAGDAVANRVRGNGWAGVVVAGEAVATVAGNLLEANAQRGAWFDETGAGSFDGNTVRASPIGLEIASGAAPVVGTNTYEDVATEVVETEVVETP